MARLLRAPFPALSEVIARHIIYGRLDCRAALQAIARSGYVRQRVFFLDEQAARKAGFRPCAVCMPEEYARWKAQH
jgi:methylphosphotriester-DNA--protein-cysteine methyltransferase